MGAPQGSRRGVARAGVRPAARWLACWAACCAAGSAACSLPDGTAVPGGVAFGHVRDPDLRRFVWCNAGDPATLDPALVTSTSEMKVVHELFDGLTSFDPEGRPRPSVARAWETSPDLRTFTFRLRADVAWSNGRPITASDFAYSLARVLHPLTASPNAEHLWRIVGAEAYTTGTARLVLRDAGDFRAGDVVVTDAGVADPNLRTPRAPLALRAAPSPAAPTWATAPPGASLTVVDVGGPGCGDPPAGRPRDPAACDWAWVAWPEGDGVAGWAPLHELDAPHGGRRYAVVAATDGRRRGELAGRDLLHLPDLLGVRAPDDRTLVVTTVGPTAWLVDLTLQRAFRPVPREAVGRWGRGWTRPGRIVTSGPFHLSAWRRDDAVELVRSETFWGRERVRLERVTVLSIADQAASANTYFQGACDAVVANHVPASYVPVLDGSAGGPRRADYVRAPQLNVYVYLLNVRRFPSAHLRRALAHALDRRQLPRLLKGGQLPSIAFTPGRPIAELSDEELRLCGVTRDRPGVATILARGERCYVPPLGPAHDPDAAGRELALARQELGDRFPRRLTIRINGGVESHRVIAEWVQHEWRRVLGLDVAIETLEWTTFLAVTAAGDFDVARMGWTASIPDPDAELLPIFKCASPENRMGWCSPEFDRLLAAAEREPDARRRAELAARAEALMIADAPIIPMFVYTQHGLRKPYVRGLSFNAIDQQALRDVWIDPAWRRAAERAR